MRPFDFPSDWTKVSGFVTTAEYLLGFEFRYGCDETASELVRRHFVQLELDDVARRFVKRNYERPLGLWASTAHAALRHLLSDFDVNGLLGAYPLHLLSTGQWQRLLRPARRHLDVGAGNGDLTRELAPLADSSLTTEHSRVMTRVLRRRGFSCVHTAGGTASELAGQLAGRQFDLVTCLNVLDRTVEPLRLLTTLAGIVSPGGCLVVAVPLPLQPFYYSGARTLAPRESLDVDGPNWETQCHQLIRGAEQRVQPLRLHSVSRAPYISGGDRARRLYVLDDAILVFRRPPAERPRPESDGR